MRELIATMYQYNEWANERIPRHRFVRSVR